MNIQISDDPKKLDVDTIIRFLSRSYWASKRPKEKIIQSLENSICYGLYDGEKQIGFARVITDGATMYWLCDVFIEESYRGQGLGTMLINAIIKSDACKNLFGYLGTKDAHTFYKQFDFAVEQEKIMSRTPDFLRKA